MTEDSSQEDTLVRKRYSSILTTPTGVEIALLYLMAGILVVVASDAVIPIDWMSYSVVALAIIALLALLRVGLVFALYLITKHKPRITAWLLTIVGVTVIGVSLWTDIDLRLRLWTSEYSFLRHVQLLQLIPLERQSELPTERHMHNWGLFTGHVYEIQDGGHTVWFKTQEGVWFDGEGSIFGGIIYVEKGEPYLEGDYAWDHLYGPWWVWRCTD